MLKLLDISVQNETLKVLSKEIHEVVYIKYIVSRLISIMPLCSFFMISVTSDNT
jgi:hypothetical protein